jgi:hypothetical protein
MPQMGTGTHRFLAERSRERSGQWGGGRRRGVWPALCGQGRS